MDLNQITMPCTDLEKSIDFYQGLGCTLIVHTHSGYARFECPDGDATFSLHKVEQTLTGEGIYVYFECEDLDNKVEHLISQGVTFQTKPTDQTWLWREARLLDPDGNQLILYHAGANRKYPPWRQSDK